MLLLAAASSGSLRDIPPEFWLRVGIGVAILIAVVFLLKKLFSVNKVVLAVVTFVALTIIGFNWIYERNEPRWATPVVQWLAEFFPSKQRR